MISFLRVKNQKNKYIQCISGLKTILKDNKNAEWSRASEIIGILDHILENLEKDLERIHKHDFIFSPPHSVASATRDIVDYLRQWHITGDAPALVAMMAASCEEFGIEQPDHVQTLMMAALLGEVENDLPYHNNLHYKKVVLQTMRMIAAHNEIFKDTPRMFNAEHITALLTAACIHDLDHDGLGNMVRGNFYQGRLERHAHEIATPYLRATGMDEKFLDLIKSMLLSTDVSPMGKVSNPMNQMKSAYRFHYKGEKEQYNTLHLDEELEIFELDPMAAEMACLLQEADIATSAGLDYTVTQYETARLYEEIRLYEARPSHVLDFLDKVCQRRFLTDAGQKLFGANMARIYALAEEDYKNGDEPYPKAQHTGFILGTSSASADSAHLN